MTIDIEKLAKEAGGTIGFIGGELAHESNRTYIFTKDELKQFAEAYAAKVLEEQSAEIAQYKAQINELREALIEVVNKTNDIKIETIAQQVLAKTPAQSLIEHNNEVIEKCANDLDRQGFNHAAEAIRALKGN